MGHLLDQGGQHLVHELAVAEDDLVDSARPDQVNEVPRHVMRADGRGQDMHVVRVLQDPRPELDPVRDLAQRAHDRDAVPSEGVQLDHVEQSCVRGSRLISSQPHEYARSPRESVRHAG